MKPMAPVVANRHHFRGRWPEGCVYVGRPSKVWLAIKARQPHVYNGTALGNPFTRREYPKDALERYAKWLWRQMRQPGSPALQALALIYPDSLLVCSCSPKPCHAEVILRAWHYLHHGSVPSTLQGASSGSELAGVAP